MDRAVTVLLDSVIIIDHLNGIPAATAFLEQQPEAAAISAVTRAEVLAGCSEENVEPVGALLASYEFVAMDAVIADRAAQLRRETRLKLPDAIQAASAVIHGLKLATRNTRDFDSAVFDFVQVPYRL